MKAILPLVFYVAMFLYVGKLSITLKPFHVALPEWFLALGYALFFAGFIIILATTGANQHHEGVMKGIDDSYKEIHKVLDDVLGENKIDKVKDQVIEDQTLEDK